MMDKITPKSVYIAHAIAYFIFILVLCIFATQSTDTYAFLILMIVPIFAVPVSLVISIIGSIVFRKNPILSKSFWVCFGAIALVTGAGCAVLAVFTGI